MSSLIMPKDLFDEHWAFASEQIYFDAKYEDEEQEKERVTYLKNLTRVKNSFKLDLLSIDFRCLQ